MAIIDFDIDADITRASTPPGAFYTDERIYEAQRELVFARSWLWLCDLRDVKAPGHVRPFTLLPGCLDEPLLVTVGDDQAVRCMSNVCTHRGAIVVEGEGHQRTLRCRYHGRRFALDGTMTFMPEFEGVRDFPSDADNLKRVEAAEWGRFLFGRLDGHAAFDTWISPMRERMAFFPVDELRFDATSSRDYAVQANWALYVENYLEPFHIAYVHQQSLGGALDYNAYRTELYPQSSLQLGVAAAGEDAFELPSGHADSGTRVAAYYWWLYPGLMLNFYPWGLSVNVVQPLGPNRTRVSFLTYVLDESRRSVGAGADVHRVELEDEEIVESVQRGLRSRLYQRGRYAPHRETGTHHFHRLLVQSLRAEAGAAG